MSWNHHILYFQLRSRSSVEERRGVLVCCLWLANGCWEVGDSVVIVRWQWGGELETYWVFAGPDRHQHSYTAGGREEGTVILLECGPTLHWTGGHHQVYLQQGHGGRGELFLSQCPLDLKLSWTGQWSLSSLRAGAYQESGQHLEVPLNINILVARGSTCTSLVRDVTSHRSV